MFNKVTFVCIMAICAQIEGHINFPTKGHASSYVSVSAQTKTNEKDVDHIPEKPSGATEKGNKNNGVKVNETKSTIKRKSSKFHIKSKKDDNNSESPKEVDNYPPLHENKSEAEIILKKLFTYGEEKTEDNSNPNGYINDDKVQNKPYEQSEKFYYKDYENEHELVGGREEVYGTKSENYSYGEKVKQRNEKDNKRGQDINNKLKHTEIIGDNEATKQFVNKYLRKQGRKHNREQQDKDYEDISPQPHQLKKTIKPHLGKQSDQQIKQKPTKYQHRKPQEQNEQHSSPQAPEYVYQNQQEQLEQQILQQATDLYQSQPLKHRMVPFAPHVYEKPHDEPEHVKHVPKYILKKTQEPVKQRVVQHQYEEPQEVVDQQNKYEKVQDPHIPHIYHKPQEQTEQDASTFTHRKPQHQTIQEQQLQQKPLEQPENQVIQQTPQILYRKPQEQQEQHVRKQPRPHLEPQNPYQEPQPPVIQKQTNRRPQRPNKPPQQTLEQQQQQGRQHEQNFVQPQFEQHNVPLEQTDNTTGIRKPTAIQQHKQNEQNFRNELDRQPKKHYHFVNHNKNQSVPPSHSYIYLNDDNTNNDDIYFKDIINLDQPNEQPQNNIKNQQPVATFNSQPQQIHQVSTNNINTDFFNKNIKELINCQTNDDIFHCSNGRIPVSVENVIEAKKENDVPNVQFNTQNNVEVQLNDANEIIYKEPIILQSDDGYYIGYKETNKKPNNGQRAHFKKPRPQNIQPQQNMQQGGNANIQTVGPTQITYQFDDNINVIYKLPQENQQVYITEDETLNSNKVQVEPTKMKIQVSKPGVDIIYKIPELDQSMITANINKPKIIPNLPQIQIKQPVDETIYEIPQLDQNGYKSYYSGDKSTQPKVVNKFKGPEKRPEIDVVYEIPIPDQHLLTSAVVNDNRNNEQESSRIIKSQRTRPIITYHQPENLETSSNSPPNHQYIKSNHFVTPTPRTRPSETPSYHIKQENELIQVYQQPEVNTEIPNQVNLNEYTVTFEDETYQPIPIQNYQNHDIYDIDDKYPKIRDEPNVPQQQVTIHDHQSKEEIPYRHDNEDENQHNENFKYNFTEGRQQIKNYQEPRFKTGQRYVSKEYQKPEVNDSPNLNQAQEYRHKEELRLRSNESHNVQHENPKHQIIEEYKSQPQYKEPPRYKTNNEKSRPSPSPSSYKLAEENEDESPNKVQHFKDSSNNKYKLPNKITQYLQGTYNFHNNHKLPQNQDQEYDVNEEHVTLKPQSEKHLIRTSTEINSNGQSTVNLNDNYFNFPSSERTNAEREVILPIADDTYQFQHENKYIPREHEHEHEHEPEREREHEHEREREREHELENEHEHEHSPRQEKQYPNKNVYRGYRPKRPEYSNREEHKKEHPILKPSLKPDYQSKNNQKSESGEERYRHKHTEIRGKQNNNIYNQLYNKHKSEQKESTSSEKPHKNQLTTTSSGDKGDRYETKEPKQSFRGHHGAHNKHNQEEKISSVSKANHNPNSPPQHQNAHHPSHVSSEIQNNNFYHNPLSEIKFNFGDALSSENPKIQGHTDGPVVFNDDTKNYFVLYDNNNFPSTQGHLPYGSNEENLGPHLFSPQPSGVPHYLEHTDNLITNSHFQTPKYDGRIFNFDVNRRQHHVS